MLRGDVNLCFQVINKCQIIKVLMPVNVICIRVYNMCERLQADETPIEIAHLEIGANKF
jgi:hypothetical protein